MKKIAMTLALVMVAGAAQAQVRFNEVLANPPGGDNGFEYVELASIPNFNLNGLTLLIIEGDNGTSGIAGTIDQAISLTGLTTGANGLLLLRDSATVLVPAPESCTTVFVSDFAPDIENGGNTWLIVSGFTGSVGTDLDADNDGVLDSTPWTVAIDGFGVQEDIPNPASLLYATELNPSFPEFPQLIWTPDAVVRIPGSSFNDLVALDVLGANPGPFSADPFEQLPEGLLPPTWTTTPGRGNLGDIGCTVECCVDFNNDLEIDFSDIEGFLAALAAMTPGDCRPGADFNNDGEFDFSDIEAFVAAFNAALSTGC